MVGIGINCGQQPEDFPHDVAPMATSVWQQLQAVPSREALAAELIRQLHRMWEAWQTEPMTWMQIYRENCVTIGQNVQLIQNGDVRQAFVEDMDDHGALLVRLADGRKETVFSGEVSVRGMYGYL